MLFLPAAHTQFNYAYFMANISKLLLFYVTRLISKADFLRQIKRRKHKKRK
jgi:hypothetical protein